MFELPFIMFISSQGDIKRLKCLLAKYVPSKLNRQFTIWNCICIRTREKNVRDLFQCFWIKVTDDNSKANQFFFSFLITLIIQHLRAHIVIDVIHKVQIWISISERMSGSARTNVTTVINHSDCFVIYASIHPNIIYKIWQRRVPMERSEPQDQSIQIIWNRISIKTWK